jgi:hypothetical protein
MSEDNYLTCSCKECGNHIEFPESAAGTTVACPHCGQWTELLTEEAPKASSRTGVKSGVIGVIGCAVAAAAVGGYFFWQHHQAATNQPAPPLPVKVVTPPTNVPPKVVPAVPEIKQKSPDDLKAGPVQLDKTKGSSLVYAVGTVTNDSEFQRFGVRIELELFNSNGKQLGTAKDYKDVIEPHREWHFHALIPDSKAASAKVSSIKED